MDAWVTFEHFHGTVEEINAAMDNIEKIRLQVNARRPKSVILAMCTYVTLTSEKGS